MRSQTTLRALAVAAVLAGCLAVSAARPTSAAKPPPPEGRAYFSVFLLDDDFFGLLLIPACVRFTDDEMVFCEDEDDDEECRGTWTRTAGGVQAKRQTSFAFEFLGENGSGGIDGQARVDDRGPKSTFVGAGADRYEAEDGRRVISNFGLMGREMRLKRCRKMADDFLGNGADGLKAVLRGERNGPD